MIKEQKTRVECDTKGCGWGKDTEMIKAFLWHNVPCPKCKKCIILTNEDMIIINALIPQCVEGVAKLRKDKLESLGNAVVSQIPEIIGRMIRSLYA